MCRFGVGFSFSVHPDLPLSGRKPCERERVNGLSSIYGTFLFSIFQAVDISLYDMQTFHGLGGFMVTRLITKNVQEFSKSSTLRHT